MEDRRRYLNARYTLEELLRRRCVPIVNENDTVTIDELKFGDNDGLAALVAVKMHAQALVIFSDVDGLYDSNPKARRDAALIETVDKITPAMIDGLCMPAKGAGVGSGGMTSKLRAARTATTHGVCVAIVNGKVQGQFEAIISGVFRGTFFPAQARRLSSRREWILTGRSALLRRIVVDDGARKALVQGHKSLLPAGIRAVEGKFQAGDIVGGCGSRRRIPRPRHRELRFFGPGADQGTQDGRDPSDPWRAPLRRGDPSRQLRAGLRHQRGLSACPSGGSANSHSGTACKKLRPADRSFVNRARDAVSNSLTDSTPAERASCVVWLTGGRWWWQRRLPCRQRPCLHQRRPFPPQRPWRPLRRQPYRPQRPWRHRWLPC